MKNALIANEVYNFFPLIPKPPFDKSKIIDSS